MNKKKSTWKNHIKGLGLGACLCRALVALPVFCALNRVEKKLTNEEVILNWFNKVRKGQIVKKADSAETKRTPDIISIKEEQIKEVDKADDGWQVITKENRVIWVPKTEK
jgi:hypothetical protein